MHRPIRILLITSLLLISTKLVFAATNYCADPVTGACLKMHDNANPVADSSGKGHTGALDSAGNPLYQASTPTGFASGSYLFTNDQITVLDSSDLEFHVGANGAMSIGGWYKFTTLDVTNGDRTWLQCKGGASTYEFCLYVKGDGTHAFLQMSVWDHTGQVVMETTNSNTILATGTWYHLDGTYNRTTPLEKIYVGTESIQSALEFTQSGLGGGAAAEDTAGNYLIGKRGDGAGTAFDGAANEQYYIGRDISLTDVQSIRTSGLDGNFGNGALSPATLNSGGILTAGGITRF